METNKKKIVIVGGGFAGVELTKKLSAYKNFEITIIDKDNYNFFPPLIYQVATGFIEYSSISYPFRKMFCEHKNVHFHLGQLIEIKPTENIIITDFETIKYDYLVLAMGTESNYFGLENIKTNALPLKNINDALRMRNHLLMNLEKATQTKIRAEKSPYMNIVIAGGGPTGVEVAGMLSELGRIIIKKEYPEFLPYKGKIYLVTSGDSLLEPMSKKSQQEAIEQLKKLDVDIKLDVAVKDFDGQTVLLSNGEEIKTKTLIWAAGVTGREANGLPKESIGRGRRILVNEYNKVQNSENIFAIGDICYQSTDANYPEGHPQLAQVALQQASLLAKNFLKIIQNQNPVPFVYKNKGSMAIISKHKAVVDLPNFFFKGFLAWATWLFIHIIPIAGFRNKAKLFFGWFLNYITNNNTLRFIIKR